MANTTTATTTSHAKAIPSQVLWQPSPLNSTLSRSGCRKLRDASEGLQALIDTLPSRPSLALCETQETDAMTMPEASKNS